MSCIHFTYNCWPWWQIYNRGVFFIVIFSETNAPICGFNSPHDSYSHYDDGRISYCYKREISYRVPVPRLESAAPSTKATCPGYGHCRVLDTAGVDSGQTWEDGGAVHGGQEREQERDDESCWVSGAGQNGRGLGGRRGRAGSTGGRKYLQKYLR